MTLRTTLSFVMTTVYIFILDFRLSAFFKPFTLKKLEVLESLLMQKIPGAVVRLYDNKHQLHIAVTNKKGYELVNDNTDTRNRKMYLTHNRHVKLKKKFKAPQSLTTTHKDIKIRTSLQNPFAKTN